ncbi:MAG: FAD-dependent oxidoreductase [Erysipelotrichaceae bacterium]|nr:FAD-dependent oxidoreductase [Erysipelotrichaceae bacterium]
MKKEYEILLTPWKIRNLEIKNRIVMAPMGGTSIFGWTEPNHFDKEAAKLLKTVADNNCGLIFPGVATVKDIIGPLWLYQNKSKFTQLKRFMDELHETGAKMFIQMTAGCGRSFALNDMMVKLLTNKTLGKLAKPILDPEFHSVAPSVTPNRWADGIYSREITKEEIAQIVYAFGETARLCKEAGVDGVEVHAVHEGYLLDQFTLPYVNSRTDEYGGSFENRYRFAVEIVKEIKKKCGEDYPVSLRYSVTSKTKGFREGAVPGEEFIEAGRTMEESERAARYLQDAGYDMLNCDNGTYDAWYWPHPPVYMPENCNLEDVAHIKKFVDIPVVCAGRMTLDAGAKAIENGDIDAIGIGRQFLTDPAWFEKVIEDREEDIKPCISCQSACLTMSRSNGTNNSQSMDDAMHMCRCALNPETMQSKRFFIKEASVKKQVAIIGGGVGGMEAALALKKRGHTPVIYEKTDQLGGVFIAAAAPDFKSHDKKLLEWYRTQLKKENIEIHFNCEITDLNEIPADAYIVATGSVAKKLPIDGADQAISAIDYLLDRKPVGNKVVIIGGGLTGCEIAYDLKRKGKEPVIIEMLNDLITTPNLCLANSSFLRDYFKANHIPVFLETSCRKITEDHVVIADKDGNETTIPCDSVIASIGYNPKPLTEKNRNIYLVGDADKVGNLRSAIWGAWTAAMKI